MSKVITFSIDMELPLIQSVQMFLNLWVDSPLITTERKGERTEAMNILAEIISLEKDPTEYVATFKTSYQISPDDWDVSSPSLKIDSNTKISEVSKFFAKYSPDSPMEVKLIQLQNLNNK